MHDIDICRAMREIFSQAMAPVVVPNIGANFVKVCCEWSQSNVPLPVSAFLIVVWQAPPAIEFADKFASPKQSWRSLADFEVPFMRAWCD